MPFQENAEVDLEMKAKALATCEIRGAVSPKLRESRQPRGLAID